MRRLRAFGLPVAAAMLILTVGLAGIGAGSYGSYPYLPVNLQYGSPEFMDRIGEVLRAIDSPSRRSNLAENWLQFSKTAITKNLELQDQWINVQRQQLRQDHLVEQQRLEMARLQLQIEQLRAENLRLERENLQIRMELNQQPPAGGPTTNGAAVQEPNDAAP